MYLFIVYPDQQSCVALFEESAGGRELRKEETRFGQRIADADRVLFIDNRCNQFHIYSLAFLPREWKRMRQPMEAKLALLVLMQELSLAMFPKYRQTRLAARRA